MQEHRNRGFTMLELLVVLLLVGLVMGMTVPRIDRQLDSARLRAFQRDVRATLEALPLQAFTQGQALEIDAQALLKRLPSPPDAARIDMPQSLRYGADGVAQGGDVWVRVATGAPLHLQVARVTGEVMPQGVDDRGTRAR